MRRFKQYQHKEWWSDTRDANSDYSDISPDNSSVASNDDEAYWRRITRAVDGDSQVSDEPFGNESDDDIEALDDVETSSGEDIEDDELEYLAEHSAPVVRSSAPTTPVQ